jgi:hypothetical protein
LGGERYRRIRRSGDDHLPPLVARARCDPSARLDEPRQSGVRDGTRTRDLRRDVNTETAGARERFPHQCPPEFASSPLCAGDEISSIERLALD